MRRILRFLWAAGVLVFGLYLFHPLFLRPLVRGWIGDRWQGEIDLGTVFLRPDFSLWIEKLTLSYPFEGRREPFLAAAGIRLHLRPGTTVPEALAVDHTRLHLRREAFAFLERRPGPPSPGAGPPAAGKSAPAALLPGPVRLSCGDGSLFIDRPRGVSIEGGSCEGTLDEQPGAGSFRLQLTCRHPQWTLAHAQCLFWPAQKASEWNFSFQRLRLDKPLRGILPDSIRPALDTFQPGGVADAETKLRRRAGEPPASSGEIRWNGGGSLRLPPFSLPLTQVRGKVRWNPEMYESTGLAGRFGPASIRMDGQWIRPSGNWHFDYRVEGLPLDGTLRRLLTAHLARGFDFLGPAGVIDLAGTATGSRLSGLSIHSYDIRFTDLSLEGVRPALRRMKGRVRLELAGIGADMQGNGQADLETVQAGPLLFDRADIPLSTLSIDGRRVVDLGISTQPLKAGCAGGVATGKVRFVDKPEPRVELDVEANDVDVERLAQQILPGSRQVKGNLHFKLHLTRNPEGLGGNGEFRVKDGDLGKIPTVQGVIEQLFARDEVDKERIRGLEGKFKVEPNKILLTEIQVKGRNMALFGRDCKIRYGGEIDFLLYAGARSDKIRKMFGPFVDRVWRGLTSVFTGILSVRVTGTLREPKHSIEPMQAPLREIVKILESLVE